MSYHGYRLPAATDLAALGRVLDERVGAAALVRLRDATALLAAALAALPEKKPGPEGRAWLRRVLLRDQVDERDMDLVTVLAPWQVSQILVLVLNRNLLLPGARRVPLFDLTFSLTFVSDTEPSGWTYAVPFSEGGRYEDIFASLAGVEEYSYRGTRPPAGVSEESWRERGAAWDRSLGYEPASRTGLTWTLNLTSLEVRAAGQSQPGGTLSPDGLAERLGSTSTTGADEWRRTLAVVPST